VARLVDILMAAVVPEWDEVLEEDEEMGLQFISTTAMSQAIQNISTPSERETREKCTHLCHYSR